MYLDVNRKPIPSFTEFIKNAKMKVSIFFIALFISSAFLAEGQDTIAIDDYRRAVSFLHENLNDKKVFNLYVQANWFPDSTGFWFKQQSIENKKYTKIAFPDLEASDLFEHQMLAKQLSDSLGLDIKANDIPIDKIEYKKPTELLITVKNESFLLDTRTHTLKTPPQEKETNNKEITSPDNKWVAYSEDYNLYIKSADDKSVKQLSTQGVKGYEYASWYGWGDIMEGENGERPNNFRVEWSKDSKWIYANICDLRSAQKMYLLDWSIDTLYRPKLLSYYRGSPGDTTMVYMEPVFFNIESGQEIKVDLPRSTHINAVEVEWSKSPNKIFLTSMSRGYQNLYIHTLDLDTEKLQRIYTESCETNIDNFDYELAEESGYLFFLSEKSGWRQLYSLDLESTLEKTITKGDFYINSIERIDEENQKIYFLASGKENGRNPYHQHLYSISFNGEDLKLLTDENRHHIVSISPDGKYLVDNISTVDNPTIAALRSTSTGNILKELASADVKALKDWSPPEIFSAIARDGETPIYGAIWKPTNFDASKRYPVIEMSYTGPHTHVFPTNFTRAFYLQSYAELGFVVVVVDGLGSSGRSKQFHDYSYKNLGGNLEDHVLAIKQLGEKYSWVDTSRVGIFGHSAGGYDAGRAVLAYPDFYKVAVASSADHDHRMEKAWWPEMYMGWLVDSAYQLQSNITNAGNLKGKLLITHGGIDENVNPSATFKLAEALIKADKQFDMLILPSQRHGYTGNYRKYFEKLRWNYFVEHLRGVEPIWDFNWE